MTIVTRPVGSFISFCSEVKAGNTCILDVLGSEGEQTPHQVVVRASTFGLYQQLAWNLFIGWLQWDMSHLFFRCWNVGFLAGVKQSGAHRLSGASRHGLWCWAFTRVTGSSLGEWDPLAVGKWWHLCLAWKACSSCAVVVAVSHPLVEVIPYTPRPLACPVAPALANARHLCYCHQPEIWALRRNSGSRNPAPKAQRMSSEAASSLYNMHFLNDSFLSTWYSLVTGTQFLMLLVSDPGSIVVITRM